MQDDTPVLVMTDDNLTSIYMSANGSAIHKSTFAQSDPFVTLPTTTEAIKINNQTLTAPGILHLTVKLSNHSSLEVTNGYLMVRSELALLITVELESPKVLIEDELVLLGSAPTSVAIGVQGNAFKMYLSDGVNRGVNKDLYLKWS